MDRISHNGFPLILLSLLLSLGLGCASGAAPLVPQKPVESEQKDHGLRFLRADLADVAAYVGEQAQMGFVLADPSLRTLSLTLYFPASLPPSRMVEVFMVSLETEGLVAKERDGYWLIDFAKAEDAGDAQRWEISFERAPLREVTAFVSEVTGKRFIVAEAVGSRMLTIQAAQGVTEMELLELLTAALEVEGLRVEVSGELLLVTSIREEEL